MKPTVLNTILLALIAGHTAWGQTKISGVVRDSDGAPVVAATILIKDTNVYAIANETGEFHLETVIPAPFVLRISSVGFRPKDVPVTEITGEPLEITLIEDNMLEEIVVTSRRRQETAQDVPIPISVVSGSLIEDAGAFNVNRIKEFVPSIQLYSSNPRNTGINIRGLGSPFGLTNDGLDPGVGFYVDGVYFARPAAATLDFIDIDQIEVLRGPQGTLFGKNTTAGAINITTRRPAFSAGATFEMSYGNYGFVQAKSSITGPLIKNRLAARISLSGTQRDGNIYNIAKDEYVNDVNNLGFRGQLLFTPGSRITLSLSGDASAQKPNGYAQVVAGVVTTQRAAYRQFNSIISDLNYSLPTLNAFDRVIDHDTPWRSLNELGGLALNTEIKTSSGTLTSTTAWRYWNWGPSNDRDFTGLQALAKSQNPSTHNNWSQEFRYAGELSTRLSGVAGIFLIRQQLSTNGTEESGTAQWRFSQSTTSDLWQTPGLFDGYGAKTYSSIASMSAAIFANVDWSATEKLHIQPGIRYNYDSKDVSYDRLTYGGLETNDPDLIALKKLVYSDQSFVAEAEEVNFTYHLSISYAVNERVNGYATYSTSFKPIGVNVAGLPVIDGQAATQLATIRPEYVKHLEVGAKSSPWDGFTLNATFYNTNIDDYQTNVQSPQLGVNRGYLANAQRVRVRGAELDGNLRASRHLLLYGALAYTDGKYVSFANGPLPLEETGRTVEGQQVAFKDISGQRLPGISRWAGSIGVEVSANTREFLSQVGNFYLAADTYFRSEFSSSPSPSRYLNIDGYGLLNTRAGFRATDGFSISIWARNLINTNYFEQLLPAAGNAGQYAGVLGDPRTVGLTLRYEL